MANISDRDRKTLLYDGIGLAAYLILFFGRGQLKPLDNMREDYQVMSEKARAIDAEFQSYAKKIEELAELRRRHGYSPADLNSATLPGEVSGAVQDAAKKSGLKLGAVRETASRGASRQLATLRCEGQGNQEALLKFLDQLDRLPFPISVDSLNIDIDPKNRSQMKLSFEVVVLNFDAWKTKSTRRNA